MVETCSCLLPQYRSGRAVPRSIEEYLDSGAWEGKSGAFGYQDGLPWLMITAGTAENVVGLPMNLLARMLENIRET